MFLKNLTQAFGVSGYEKQVREIILEEMKGYADEVTIDALGNLILFKKGTGCHKKKIMMSAHMDEIGFQVLKIDDRGFITARALGGIPIQASVMNRVQFRNGVQGIIANNCDFDGLKNIKKLYIDIGASSKEEAETFVKIGDVGCYVGEYLELKGHNICAKALDDRIGCYILAETLKKVTTPYHDLYFVFSTQEEVGLRGATVAANRIQPDLGIALDVTISNDYPNSGDGANKLGGGTAIKISDGSVICDEYLVDAMIECCETHQIKYQRDVIDGGGTDAGAINRSHLGVRCAGISVATRYVHGPNAVVNMDDVHASIDLLYHYIHMPFTF